MCIFSCAKNKIKLSEFWNSIKADPLKMLRQQINYAGNFHQLSNTDPVTTMTKSVEVP